MPPHRHRRQRFPRRRDRRYAGRGGTLEAPDAGVMPRAPAGTGPRRLTSRAWTSTRRRPVAVRTDVESGTGKTPDAGWAAMGSGGHDLVIDVPSMDFHSPPPGGSADRTWSPPVLVVPRGLRGPCLVSFDWIATRVGECVAGRRFRVRLAVRSPAPAPRRSFGNHACRCPIPRKRTGHWRLKEWRREWHTQTTVTSRYQAHRPRLGPRAVRASPTQIQPVSAGACGGDACAGTRMRRAAPPHHRRPTFLGRTQHGCAAVPAGRVAAGRNRTHGESGLARSTSTSRDTG